MSRWVTPPETESLALECSTARRSVDYRLVCDGVDCVSTCVSTRPNAAKLPLCYISTIVGLSGHADEGRKLSFPLVRSKDQGLGARDALSLLVVAVFSHFRRVTPHTGRRHSTHRCTTGPRPLRTFEPLNSPLSRTGSQLGSRVRSHAPPTCANSHARHRHKP